MLQGPWRWRVSHRPNGQGSDTQHTPHPLQVSPQAGLDGAAGSIWSMTTVGYNLGPLQFHNEKTLDVVCTNRDGAFGHLFCGLDPQARLARSQPLHPFVADSSRHQQQRDSSGQFKGCSATCLFCRGEHQHQQSGSQSTQQRPLVSVFLWRARRRSPNRAGQRRDRELQRLPVDQQPRGRGSRRY